MPEKATTTKTKPGGSLAKADLLELYQIMYRGRRLDSVVESWQRMGRSHFYIGSAGHEALLAGVALHFKPGVDWVVTHYRDLIMALRTGLTPKEVLAAAVGSTEEPGSRGRQIPYHFGKPECRLYTASSPVGTQFLTGVGMGYASLFYSSMEHWKGRTDLFHPDEFIFVGTGDGTTSQGEFWEALNFAANPVHPCPVLFCVEDNGWAISTSVAENTPGGSLPPLLSGYREQGFIWLDSVDGLDPIKCATAAGKAIDWIRRERKPAILHGKVMRFRGHSCEDDERLYRTPEDIAKKQEGDPLKSYPQFLIEEGIVSESELARVREEVDREIDEARDYIDRQIETNTVPFPAPDSALEHLYSDKIDPASAQFDVPARPEGEPITLIHAINRTLHTEFARNPALFTLGEDVADVSNLADIDRVVGKGGVFGGRTGGITANLQRQFGPRRCFNSPLAEGCIMGVANGAAVRGLKAAPEIQFDDYFWPAYHHFRSETATMRWRSAGAFTMPVVIRVPSQGYTGGIGAIWHSQSNEAAYVVPGVRVALPCNPTDAVGLLRTALRSDDPVVFLEPKVLYRRTDLAEPYPGDDFTIPFGKARTVVEGDDITLVTWGIPVHLSKTVALKLKGEGIGVHVLDLRTLSPWDHEAVAASIERTGRLLVVHGAARMMGFGIEVVSWVSRHCFDLLLAPPTIRAALDCYVGYGTLEKQILPQEEDIEASIREVLAYD